MKPQTNSPNETSKNSTSNNVDDDEAKEQLNISEDERDIFDATSLVSPTKLPPKFQNENSKISPSNTTTISPTTLALIKENNQVLCPSNRKTNFPRKYCGSFAKLTYMVDLDDETLDTYETAFSHELEKRKIICTCCAECKFCRRLSASPSPSSNFGQKKRDHLDAATQTNFENSKMSSSTISADTGKESKCPSQKTAAASRIVCTYLAEASDEFYPFSKIERKRIDDYDIEKSKVDEKFGEKSIVDQEEEDQKRSLVEKSNVDQTIENRSPIPISSTPIRQPRIGLAKSRSRKAATISTTRSSSDLFLDYLKLLILRQKQKAGDEFWAEYGSAFQPRFGMSSEEVETCRRRFGDGWAIDQLKRMFPLALKSSTPEWRRQFCKSSIASKTAVSISPIPVDRSTPKTPIDQYVRIDRTRVISVKKPTTTVVKNSRTFSIRSTIAASSSPISYAPNQSVTPSKLRPVKMNRTAILRADAIYSKYWSTN